MQSMFTVKLHESKDKYSISQWSCTEYIFNANKILKILMRLVEILTFVSSYFAKKSYKIFGILGYYHWHVIIVLKNHLMGFVKKEQKKRTKTLYGCL